MRRANGRNGVRGKGMARSVLVRLHRYIGLAIAAFLMLAGLTGSILSWDEEIDSWINGDLVGMTVPGRPQSPGALADLIEAREKRGQVTFFPLRLESGKPAQFTVRPRTDPRTGEPYRLDFTHVFVDPVSGAELGRRDGDGATLSRRSLVPFLVRFHYSLQIPEMWGIADWGLWLTGTVALAWFLNLVVGLFVSLPARRRELEGVGSKPEARIAGPSFWQRWKPAWRIRWKAGAFPLTFDLHRAVALWTMPLLLLLSFTAFSQNLLVPFLPDPLEVSPTALPAAPAVDGGVDRAVVAARLEARRLGWTEGANQASFDSTSNLYRVYFVGPGGDLGGGDVGMKTLVVDGATGALVGRRTRWEGSAGEVFVKAQFPLHSLRLFGLPGRIISSLLGMMVMLMTVTGILIWARKRRARKTRRRVPSEPVQGFAE